MIEIKDLGSYLELDENGFLIKKADPSLIQDSWKAPIQDTVRFYRDQLGEELYSVYIRGSVAKGMAVDHISDVDSFFISKNPVKISSDWKKQFQNEIREKHLFCDGVEIGGAALTQLEALRSPKKRNGWQELIKTQSVCVYGKDLSDEIKPFELKDMVAHSYSIDEDIRSLFDEPESFNEQACKWIMKRLIRTGFEIVMMREQKWTRDLYPCVQSFSRHYPEHQTIMRNALDLVLNPSTDSKAVFALIEQFRPWMLDEIKMHVPYADTI